MASATDLTYRNELRRAVAAGVLDAASGTFLLLVAVRWFHAGSLAKGLIASGGGVGFILTPLVVWCVERGRFRASQAAAVLFAAGGVAFAAMAFVPGTSFYVVGSLLGLASANCVIPLLTQIYKENYPERMRGKLFSRTTSLRIGVSVIAGEVVGRLLEVRIDLYIYLLMVLSVLSVYSSVCLARCPSAPLEAAGSSDLFRGIRLSLSDQLFRRTILCWMLMGFGNLMMLPMRVEYLANPRYGLTLTVSEVALYTAVIPNIARLCLSQVWGILFDTVNFFALRIILNLGFALGIFTFFFSNSTVGLVLGAITFGAANAGGDVAWNLWVTKFAPSDRVADYMSAHVFFTGLRSLAAPLLAFQLINTYSIQTLGWISAAFIVAASLLLIPELVKERGRLEREAEAELDAID